MINLRFFTVFTSFFLLIELFEIIIHYSWPLMIYGQQMRIIRSRFIQ